MTTTHLLVALLGAASARFLWVAWQVRRHGGAGLTGLVFLLVGVGLGLTVGLVSYLLGLPLWTRCIAVACFWAAVEAFWWGARRRSSVQHEFHRG